MFLATTFQQGFYVARPIPDLSQVYSVAVTPFEYEWKRMALTEPATKKHFLERSLKLDVIFEPKPASIIWQQLIAPSASAITCVPGPLDPGVPEPRRKNRMFLTLSPCDFFRRHEHRGACTCGRVSIIPMNSIPCQS
ncbi:hypothetical protein CC2G_007271 [Coprinopsis cinerea AmutBmut pab1-1]|nr:hypothetical protein CC2G_007271 [Coprinopsis cinerea AmutBmut pab1-1]